MTQPTAPCASVSTWSLHRALGVTFIDKPADGSRTRTETYGPGSLTLLEIPARLAEMGIHTMEICHFQLPSRDAGYLSELRGAIADANVKLLSVLIDDGDITHPEHHARDLNWIGGWIETAGLLGAERARVIAGKADYSEAALAQSRAGLQILAAQAQGHGVRVTTENWFALLACPESVLSLLDSLEGAVGLNLDFGNWGGATKYDDLAKIFPRAESCHAKCAFTASNTPDADDFRRCLDLGKSAGFAGPLTLIYDSPGDDEWACLAIEQELIAPYLA